jgi:hypothetical protein
MEMSMLICYLIITLLMVIIHLQRCFNVLLVNDVFWKGASIAQPVWGWATG